MPIAMIEAFIGQPAKHNCLVLIITRLRHNKNDVICPVADDDFHGSSKRTTRPSPTGIAADCGEYRQAARSYCVSRDPRGRRGFGRVIDWRLHKANAPPAPGNIGRRWA
jgi:hypothetical protein